MAQFNPPDDFDRLRRRVRRATGRLVGLVEEFESIDLELAAMRDAARAISSEEGVPQGGGRSPLATVRTGWRIKEALRRAAETGIAAIAIKRRPNGSAIAVIDGKHVDLPRRLADVLAVLVSQATASARLVPFRELTVLVEQKSGTPLTRRATAQLVWRLRNAFLEAGLSSFLIESQPNRRGIRLLLRRPR